MQQQYEFKDIEKKWQDKWAAEDVFKVTEDESKEWSRSLWFRTTIPFSKAIWSASGRDVTCVGKICLGSSWPFSNIATYPFQLPRITYNASREGRIRFSII